MCNKMVARPKRVKANGFPMLARGRRALHALAPKGPGSRSFAFVCVRLRSFCVRFAFVCVRLRSFCVRLRSFAFVCVRFAFVCVCLRVGGFAIMFEL